LRKEDIWRRRKTTKCRSKVDCCVHFHGVKNRERDLVPKLLREYEGDTLGRIRGDREKKMLNTQKKTLLPFIFPMVGRLCAPARQGPQGLCPSLSLPVLTCPSRCPYSPQVTRLNVSIVLSPAHVPVPSATRFPPPPTNLDLFGTLIPPIVLFSTLTLFVFSRVLPHFFLQEKNDRFENRKKRRQEGIMLEEKNQRQQENE